MSVHRTSGNIHIRRPAGSCSSIHYYKAPVKKKKPEEKKSDKKKKPEKKRTMIRQFSDILAKIQEEGDEMGINNRTGKNGDAIRRENRRANKNEKQTTIIF